MAEGVAERLRIVQEKIAEASLKSQRSHDSVKLVAVTKTVSVDRIQEIYDLGYKCFGENKVQDYLDKKDHLPLDTVWNFIGRLQTNKVKYVIRSACAGQLSLFQSLDRVELAAEIEKQALKHQLKRFPSLIQVNSSREQTKAGFLPEEVEGFVASLDKNSVIEVRGLMTIGPQTDNQEDTRRCFREVRELFERLKHRFGQHPWDALSMGMSGDYETAIAEGSTLVRIGSAIFGIRA